MTAVWRLRVVRCRTPAPAVAAMFHHRLAVGVCLICAFVYGMPSQGPLPDRLRDDRRLYLFRLPIGRVSRVTLHGGHAIWPTTMAASWGNAASLATASLLAFLTATITMEVRPPKCAGAITIGVFFPAKTPGTRTHGCCHLLTRGTARLIATGTAERIRPRFLRPFLSLARMMILSILTGVPE